MNDNNTITKITDVPEYLKQVKEIYGLDKNRKTVFRGEQKIYSSSTFPNIFRDTFQLQRDINPQFELNILNSVRAEGFDNEESYLLTAIEAQHGGFPSRLLDVTFNSLIALHFAVTPYMNDEITKYDEEDGQVILIDVSRMISPASEDLENMYCKMLCKSESASLMKDPIFAYEHFVVDYYRKNKRIEAQQGGFILFSGENYRPLPESIINRIIVDASAKKQIRKELDEMFGINNVFVYPEVSNYPYKILENSKYYGNGHCFKEEDLLKNIKLNVIENIKYNCDVVRESIVELFNDSNPENIEIYLNCSKKMLDYITLLKYDIDYSINSIKDEKYINEVKDLKNEVVKYVNRELRDINDMCLALGDTKKANYKIEFKYLER